MTRQAIPEEKLGLGRLRGGFVAQGRADLHLPSTHYVPALDYS